MLYFDNAATTSIDEEVLNTYTNALKKYYNNPSATHRFGMEGNNLLLSAKRQIAKYLSFTSCKEDEIILTSGATESNNLAIKGYVERYKKRGKHLITTKVEHPSVLNVYKNFEQSDYDVTYLDVTPSGIDENALKSALRDDTILVSIMAVNNEVGAIYDINKLAKIVKENSKAAFFTDATQALYKVSIDYRNCDLISFSAHKLHGLKGSGLLIKKNNIDLVPLLDGGGQENGYRSGTTNLPTAIALATTFRRANQTYEQRVKNATALNSYLIEELEKIPEISILPIKDKSPFILNFVMKEHKASVIAEALSRKDIMVSTKSACSSKKVGGSYVLKAYGYDDYLSGNGIRLSFSGDESLEDGKIFMLALNELLSSIRKDQQ